MLTSSASKISIRLGKYRSLLFFFPFFFLAKSVIVDDEELKLLPSVVYHMWSYSFYLYISLSMYPNCLLLHIEIQSLWRLNVTDWIIGYRIAVYGVNSINHHIWRNNWDSCLCSTLWAENLETCKIQENCLMTLCILKQAPEK